MGLGNELRVDLNQFIKSYGKIFRIRYYEEQHDKGDYDDQPTLIKSGTDIYTSGLIFPINANRGSTEYSLLEQGKVLTNDSTAFFTGNVNFESSDQIKIGVGSPVSTGSEFMLIPNTINSYEVAGEIVYKKIFIRRLSTGKLPNEA